MGRTSRRDHAKQGWLGLGGLLVLGVLAASGARAEEGNILSNIFKYGGTTVPPSQAPELEAAYCPPVGVTEGGAALQAMGGQAGNAASIRTQMSLGRLARECTRRQDGSVSVKVGVEGRVLLGPAGAPGRFDVRIDGVDMERLMAAGASPRGMMTLMRAARVVAWLDGRSHVVPDDIAHVFPATMGHRLFFTPLYETRRAQIADALAAQILQRVPTPR